METTIKPAINGSTVVLTINGNIQRIVEKKISEFNEAYGSKHTSVIIADPNNGQILSMAQYPRASTSIIQTICRHITRKRNSQEMG